MKLILLSPFLLRWYCWVLLAANPFVSDVTSADAYGESDENRKNVCRSYIAPSTLPGAGLGMFAGRDFDSSEEITPGDITVAILDMAYHQGKQRDSKMPFLWNEYTWSGSSFMGMPQEATKSSGASFGLGACPNNFYPLINFGDSDEYNLRVDSAGLHRNRDPGAGAFTRYHDRRGVAWTQIPQGMELFVDYGESYWSSSDRYKGMPTSKREYDFGDELLLEFVSLRQLLQEDLDHQAAVRLATSTFSVVHEIKRIWQSSILYTLPEDFNHVDHIATIGVRNVHYNRSIQSIDWITENGLCSDNLHPGISTIQQAGRGAFTRRRIAKGDVIAPGPLIHIGDRSMLNMYLPYPVSDELERDTTKVYHKQLLLNYCFGHQRLNILLCPYGVNTGLINHSKEKANAKIVWSTKLMKNPEWLKKHPSEWAHLQHSGLAIDYVATRDLDANEEVFIDYGDEWQMAWDEHIAHWSPPRNSHSFYVEYGRQGEMTISAMEDLVIPTVAEGSFGAKYQELNCREIFRRWWGLPHHPGDYYPCRATDRYEKDGETVYNVEILNNLQQEGHDDICIEEFDEVLFGVPVDIFVAEDQLYSTDQSQPWSFRHDMRLPDELVPDQWFVAEPSQLGKDCKSDDSVMNNSSSLCIESQIPSPQHTDELHAPLTQPRQELWNNPAG